MILFDVPTEKSTPFRIYLPPDLLEQVKAQQHRRLKAEFNRRAFDKLLKKLSQTDLFDKDHVEDYLRYKYRRNCRANLEVTLRYAKLSDRTREEEYFKAMSLIGSEEIHEPDQRDRQLPPPFEAPQLLGAYR